MADMDAIFLSFPAAVHMAHTETAPPVSKTFDLPEFDHVDCSSGLRAVVSPGSGQSVRLEAGNRQLLERIKVEVVARTLRARHGGNPLGAFIAGSVFNLAREATLFVTLPVLSGVTAATGANVTIDVALGETFAAVVSTGAVLTVAATKADDVNLVATTSGIIEIGGACDRLDIRCSSGGRISAVELAATEMKIEAAGGAVVEATALERVSGHVRNGANVTLNGRPGIVEVGRSSGGTLTIC